MGAETHCFFSTLYMMYHWVQCNANSGNCLFKGIHGHMFFFIFDIQYISLPMTVSWYISPFNSMSSNTCPSTVHPVYKYIDFTRSHTVAAGRLKRDLMVEPHILSSEKLAWIFFYWRKKKKTFIPIKAGLRKCSQAALLFNSIRMNDAAACSHAVNRN